jgi:hypothetical protein
MLLATASNMHSSPHNSDYSQVSYPISILVQSLPLQYPNTPKSTPPNDARGICLTIGVEMTEINRQTNAANNKIVKGVAGRNILKLGASRFRNDCGCQRLQDAAGDTVCKLSMRKEILRHFVGMVEALKRGPHW